MLNKHILNLKPGDIIAVAYDNYLTYGIFRGYGKDNNLHYFFMPTYFRRPPQKMTPEEAIDDWLKQALISGQKGQKRYVTYINTSSSERVVRVAEDNFLPEEWAAILEFRNLLIKFNSIKIP